MSDHYFREEDKDCLSDTQSFNGPQVTMPNNLTLKATERGGLDLSGSLSKEVKATVILPGLKSSSLVSFGKLYDDDCDISLTKQKMDAVNKNEIVLESTQNFNDKLWDIPIYKTNISPCSLADTPHHVGLYTLPLSRKPIRKEQRYQICLQSIKISSIP